MVIISRISLLVEISLRGVGLIEKIESAGNYFEEKGRERGMRWRVGEDIARYPGAFISRFIRATASTIQLDVASVPCRHCPPDCLVKSNTLCSD